MDKVNSSQWLCLKRTVRFGETDAAGVVHFLQLFKWCHEAWEESLDKYGIILQDIFPSSQLNRTHLENAFPVVHCEANYFQPLYVGDKINIELCPEKIDDFSFRIRFEIKNNEKKICIASIKHKSINPITRKRCSLSKQLNLWLEKSI